MTVIKTSLAALACAALFVAIPARADDAGLYDKPPPAGSTFVRFINAGDAAGSGSINGKSRGETKPGEISAYRAIPHGELKLAFGAATTTHAATEKEFYTVAAQGGKLTVFKDTVPADKLKAQVLFYNLTEAADVAIKTADGKVAAVGPVAAHASADRQINPVKVPFAIFAGEAKLADLSPVAFERGQSYAVALLDASGKNVTPFVKAEITTK